MTREQLDAILRHAVILGTLIAWRLKFSGWGRALRALFIGGTGRHGFDLGFYLSLQDRGGGCL